jgi:hypothetical protein
VQHNLVGILRGVACISLAPVVADSVSKAVSSVIKGCCRNSATSRWVSLKSVLCDTIPEVKCAVRTSCAKGSMDGVERDGVDRVDVCHVVLWRVSVALEGEVGATNE